MELRQLEYFRVIAETESIHEAALICPSRRSVIS